MLNITNSEPLSWEHQSFYEGMFHDQLMEHGIGTLLGYFGKHNHCQLFMVPHHGGYVLKKKFNTNPQYSLYSGSLDTILNVASDVHMPEAGGKSKFKIVNLNNDLYVLVRAGLKKMGIPSSNSNKTEAVYDLFDKTLMNLEGSYFSEVRNRIRRNEKAGLRFVPLSLHNMPDALKVFVEWKGLKREQYESLWQGEENFKGAGGFGKGQRVQLACGMYESCLSQFSGSNGIGFIGYIGARPVCLVQGFKRISGSSVDFNTSIVVDNELTRPIKVAISAIYTFLKECESQGFSSVSYGDYSNMALGVRRTKNYFRPILIKNNWITLG